MYRRITVADFFLQHHYTQLERMNPNANLWERESVHAKRTGAIHSGRVLHTENFTLSCGHNAGGVIGSVENLQSCDGYMDFSGRAWVRAFQRRQRA